MNITDGLHVLASLDGSPLAACDALALGLSPDAGERGCAMVARDRGTALPAENGCAFLGHIDDRPALAAALGLDTATPAAELLQAALARYGDEAAGRVPGEWSFAHWDAAARTLTLAVSDTLRDPLLLATDGRRVAVAPDIHTMRRVGGIGAFDARGLLLSMGRAPVRSTITDQTILAGVRRVVAGTCVRISNAGVTAGARQPLPAPQRWRDSFDEAIEALDSVLRAIVRAQMARHPRAAVMLSGGLDSSLLAAFAASEKGPGGSPFAVTSVAPPGSGLPDEGEVSRAVADRLGIGMTPVVPHADADVYDPSPLTRRWMNQPMCSPRHYLYEALYAVAADQGADAVFDGSYGEASLTGHVPDPRWHRRLRSAVGSAVREARAGPRRDATRNAFHVRLSGDALALARGELDEALRIPDHSDRVRHGDEMWGYSPAVEKNLREGTVTSLPGMRQLLPFRDRRLLTLFAGMPVRFLTEGGLTRAPGRALLAGKVPEHVQLRPRGLPFSPDYMERIHRQAAAARNRLPEYRRAGAGDWVDLDWLDGMLAGIAGGTRVPLKTAFSVQATACAAAFFAGWSSAG